MTEDEMVGWHHRLNGHEFEQALAVGDGQGGLPCCSPWGCKESDMTQQMNNNSISTQISTFKVLSTLPYLVLSCCYSVTQSCLNLFISSSDIPFSSSPQSFPASGSFLVSRLFTWWPQYWSFSFSISTSNEQSRYSKHKSKLKGSCHH